MTTQGGIIEQKTIGIQIGLSGTHNKTDIVNGQVQLKPIDTDFGGIAYAEEGSWISDVIDIGDNFNSYGKLFTTHTDENGSTISVLTRTSDDGITFDGWFPIALDGTIQSVKKRFIQVRVNLFAAFGDYGYSVLDKFEKEYADTTNGLKLKRNYEFDMTKDESWVENGSLHKKQVVKDEWLRLDKLNVKDIGSFLDKSLIFNNGEYKKWNGISPRSWESVTSTPPNQQQFTSDGMDELSPLLDRKVIAIEPIKMDIEVGILQQGEVGKVFSKTLDFKKYIDIRSITAEADY